VQISAQLGTHCLDATQQELAEASCLFDLSEHRLDDLFSQPVPAAPSRLLELVSHGLRQWPAGPALVVVGVLGPPRGNVAGDIAIRERCKVRLRAVARIGGGLPSSPGHTLTAPSTAARPGVVRDDD
jgi:hypothetical protein